MREFFCLFLCMLQFTDGCYVSDHKPVKEVTGYTGGSVLLPCSCTDPQSTVKTLRWNHYHKGKKQWIEVFKHEEFKDRLKLFNERLPTNLSLLISDLRKEDEGDYRCQISQTYKDFRVTIKGCDLDQSKPKSEVTGHSGESVVLPCSCTELQAKPEQLTWTFTPLNPGINPEEIYPHEQSERHTGRVKLLNEISPGNLSLQISNLNKEDQGEYRCSVSSQRHVSIRLTVQGCDLDQSKPMSEVTGHSGDSVVLPCSCTELQDKPEQLTWTFTPLKHRTKPEEIYPHEQSGRHTGRVKLLIEKTSPGNLSLQISNLATEDQGEYQCSVLYQQHVNITLTVQVQTSEGNSIKSFFILLSVLPIVLLLVVLALIYWKCRGRRDVQKTNNGLVLVCSENEKQCDVNPNSVTHGENLKQDENEDEVTYSSVVHVKTASKPAHIQTDITEHSEYASIK